MFDVGGPEAVALIVLGVVLLGPKRLMQVTQQVKGVIHEGKRLVRDTVDGLERDIVTAEVRENTKREPRDRP